jgi:hypothetical protein
MVRSVEHYPSETIVVVHAKLRKAPQRIKNATIHDHELEIYEVHKVGSLTEHVPFTVYDAENINRDRDSSEDGEEEDSLSPGSPSENNTPRSSQDASRPSQEDPANGYGSQDVSRRPHDGVQTTQHASRSMCYVSI